MSFIAMNRFRVRPEKAADFEHLWATREGRLKEMDGFVEFRMLKGPEKDGYRLYSSHTLWADRTVFEAWTTSQQFRDSHRNAGKSGTKDMLMGPPEFEGFDTVLHET